MQQRRSPSGVLGDSEGALQQGRLGTFEYEADSCYALLFGEMQEGGVTQLHNPGNDLLPPASLRAPEGEWRHSCSPISAKLWPPTIP